MTDRRDAPFLTDAQVRALRLCLGRTLHLARGGYCYDLRGPYVARATAKALAHKGLAAFRAGGTWIELTRRGRAIARGLVP